MNEITAEHINRAVERLRDFQRVHGSGVTEEATQALALSVGITPDALAQLWRSSLESRGGDERIASAMFSGAVVALFARELANQD